MVHPWTSWTLFGSPHITLTHSGLPKRHTTVTSPLESALVMTSFEPTSREYWNPSTAAHEHSDNAAINAPAYVEAPRERLSFRDQRTRL